MAEVALPRPASVAVAIMAPSEPLTAPLPEVFDRDRWLLDVTSTAACFDPPSVGRRRTVFTPPSQRPFPPGAKGSAFVTDISFAEPLFGS